MADASKGATLDLGRGTKVGDERSVTSENLRREIRFEARIPVSVHRGRAVISTETSDVSFRGLFLRTADALPLRSLVRLRVMLPSGRTIEVHAMVAHVVDGGGVGLQFWGLSGKDRTAWDSYVGKLVPPAKPKKHTHAADLETPTGVRVRMPVDAKVKDPKAAGSK
jgi:hypothetical protein